MEKDEKKTYSKFHRKQTNVIGLKSANQFRAYGPRGEWGVGQEDLFKFLEYFEIYL